MQTAIIEGIGKVNGTYNDTENWFEVWEGGREVIGCYEMKFVKNIRTSKPKETKYTYTFKVAQYNSEVGVIRTRKIKVHAYSLDNAYEIIEKRYPFAYDISY